MYADDAIIMYSSQNSTEIMQQMKDDLNKIIKWLKINGLAINTKKCTYIIFEKKGKIDTSPNEIITESGTITKSKEKNKIFGTYH